MRRKKIIIKIITLFILILSGDKLLSAADFSYIKILKEEYKFKAGTVVPVTIEQAIETDGDITRDGRYFFFTSDRDRGNFDIYLRDLSDIIYFKITGHASRDTSPAVSPDMKYLAFVSEREDPEGDIFTVKIDSKELIEEARESVTEIPTLDSGIKNISLFQDPVTKTIKIIKDASPCWSPDSKRIAFSSARDGLENIWIMDRDGDNKKQLTKKGGMYPRFSEDGNSIIYISYSESKNNGDVYIMDIASLGEKQITKTDDIELYPSFMGNSDEIIYTLINRDTNKDGKIDLKDNSIIFYKNLKTGMEYPLTSYSESSFSPKWSQALNLKDLFSGVIIFSNQVERNININLIPDFGIIPIRESDGARKQYELAEKYLYEYDDRERYLLALEKIYHIFGEKNDIESKIYVSRGLVEAAKQYKSAGSAKDVERIVSIISSISKNEYDYSSISARYLIEILKGGDGALIINKAIAALSEDSKLNSYVPYLMEELGNEYIRSGRPAEAIRTYENIIKKYSDYKRIIYIHDKLISLTYTSLKDDLTPSHIALFESTYYTLIFDNYNKLIAIFESERNTRKRMSLLEGMLKKYDDKKSLLPLLYYEAGNTAFEMGNPALARKHINDSLKLLKDNNPLYYRANIILGRIEEQENNFPAMENNYYLAAINYKKWFRDPNYRAVVEKLISYYEEYGERADYSGDYKTSGKLYGHYVFVANYLNWLKIFNDIYNDSAPRAHVLYIDAYSNSVNNEIGAIQKLVGAYTDGNDYLRKLDQAIMDLNKAHMYGLGYLYSKIALACDTEAAGVVPDVTQLISSRQEDALKNFKTAVDQIQWALFMDDTFIDPEILRGWIYQYVDLKRKEDQEKNSGKNEKTFAKYFPKYLWEKNIAIYEKALETNDEGLYPETEGNLHLNLANSHFLLNNYPRAFTHYKLAEKHKAGFNSKIEEALFYYHLGYCYWQNSEIEDAKNRMSLTLDIYRSLSSGKGKKYKQQIYYIYKFFALFERTMKNYREAITWYNRIIDFASSNKINLDRARYYQEMAYCYRELGETGTALSYLKKSDMFLEKAEVTPQKFPVTVGVFGLFSFPMPFFDLGIDGTLVGDSKINAELNALQKKLLNVSMEEEIFYSRGNLEKSVQCLNKKLDLLKEAKTKSEISSKIRALNNIGFCYYRMHKYKEAGEYFQKAWDYALDPEVNDLEGIFIAILNSTHLYTFMLENRITGPADPSAQVDALLKKIEDYKNSYEAARLKEENDKLKNEAEAKKREVTAGELNAVKDIVSSETAEKYFTLDIAAGILKFRKAEQMRESAGEKNNYSGERNITRSFAYYKFNKDLFDLYSEAEIGFENALAKAELRPSRKLQIKLLLNIAGCQKRTGQFAEAYSTYSSAEKLARQYEYNDLIWKTCYHTADFLVEFGEIAEGAGYLDIAEDYYKNATGIIEEFPFLYAGDISKIKKLFMEYTGLLVRKGNHEDAILNSESLYEISRLIHISLSSSELNNEYDRNCLNEFVNRMTDIEDLYNSITLARESGEGDDSENLKVLKNRLEVEKLEFKNFIKKTSAARPVLASFISLSNKKIPRHPDSVIYKFYKNNGRLAVWQIYAGKIKFKEMNFLETDKLSEISGINQIINSEKDDKINYKFIILNDTILDILKAGRETIPGVMYIPSIERASHYKMPKAVSIKNIFYNGTGIRDRLSAGKELIIDEGSGLNTDLTRYSVIIDNSNILNTQRLFSERLEPALVIKNAAGWDIDRINFFLEASLYSGIKSTVLCFGSLNAAEASGIMAEASQKSFDSISCSANQNTALIAAGFRGYDISERKTLLPGIKNNELEQFRSKLQDCRPDEANTHLQKWFNISGDDPSGDEITYNLSMSEIELMAGNPGGSLDYAGKAENLSSASYPELNAEAQSLSVYIALYNGELMTAGKLLGSTNNQIFKNSADFSIYQSIIDISSGNSAPSIEKYKNLISKTPLLPVNRLKLIYADYLNTLKYDITARTVLTDWRGNFTLSGRDALLVTLLKAEIEDIKYPSQRSGDINKLKNSPLDAEEIKNRAALLLENNGSYDMLTPFTLLYAANRLIEKKDRDSAIALIDDINFEKLLSESKWNDALLALSLAIKLYDSEKRYDDSLRCIRYAISIARSRTLTFAVRYLTYKEAVTLVMLGRHKESYDSASAGLSLAEKDEDLLIRYQLLLMEDELFLGKTAEAALREEKIKTTGKPEYLYLLNLLKARIEMLKILGGSKSADTDWATIEKHITASLENIDSSPDVLNKFNRMDLLKESLNILISYKMSRKDIYRALYYNEIKKQLELRSKLPYLAEKDKIPADIIRQFKITSDEKICTQLLKKNPLLQINALAGILPLNSYQKKIPKDAVTIYLGAFENDILGWVITEKDVNGVRIKDGFIKVDDILKKYQDDISRMKSTMDTSKKLYLLLKDLERYYKDKKIIIFITDNELEQIPFEITGETNMLDETHAIIYAPSILSSFLNFNDGNNNVNITGNSNGSVLNSLDLISIKESGIPYSTGKTQPSGISHIQGKISFDTEKGYLYIDDSMFFESTGKAGIIYIPDFSIGNKITLNELSNKNSIYGIKATIINDSRIQDVNNAIFINSFYGGIMEKKNIIAAFRQAKEAVRTNKKYSNPCYWAGIRLFFNGSLNY